MGCGRPETKSPSNRVSMGHSYVMTTVPKISVIIPTPPACLLLPPGWRYQGSPARAAGRSAGLPVGCQERHVPRRGHGWPPGPWDIEPRVGFVRFDGGAKVHGAAPRTGPVPALDPRCAAFIKGECSNTITEVSMHAPLRNNGVASEEIPECTEACRRDIPSLQSMHVVHFANPGTARLILLWRCSRQI